MSEEKELTVEQKEEVPLKLAAGRIRAMELAPYLSVALLSLTPREVQGIGTFAVDKYWHMYYDPFCCIQWTVDEIAAVWIHEVNHLLRSHAQRFEQYSEPDNSTYWNAATDAAINSDLKDMHVILPDPDHRYYAQKTPQTPLWKKGMTAEQLYELFRPQKPTDQKAPPGGQDGNSTTPQASQDGSSEAPEGSDGQGDPQENSSEQSGNGDGNNENNLDEKLDAQGTGQSTGQDTDEGLSGDGDQQGGGQSSSNDDNNDVASSNPQNKEANTGREKTDTNEKVRKTFDCGSGSDNIERKYDVGKDENSINEGQEDIIIKETAEEIEKYAMQKPGTVPGGMVRAAAAILHPKVNWRKLLMVKVRAKVAEVIGVQDYSYKKPSRRRSSGNFIFPSMRSSQKPRIYIIIDTSGSMQTSQLNRALSEISVLLKRHRGSVYVISCDTYSTESQLVSSIKDIQLIGNGGTDMCNGIHTAVNSEPSPDIIIVITDALTPWPSNKPKVKGKDIKYLALVTEFSKKNYSFDAHIKQIPSWFDVIVVEK